MADLSQVLQVNLWAFLVLCRDVASRVLEHTLRRSGRIGTIINVAPLLSFSGGVTVTAYTASKRRVGQRTWSFSHKWACMGVTVNAIAPDTLPLR